MSYKCDKCDKVRIGSELKRVVEVREVTYNKMYNRYDRKEKRQIQRFDSNSVGYEIVETQRLCEDCFEETKDMEPRVSKKTKTINYVGERTRRNVKTHNRGGENIDVKGLKDKWEGKK